MKHLILIAATALLPAAALAQDAPAGAALPLCSATVQDSCQQGPKQEARAIDHYPADERDAGNNKVGGHMMRPKMVMLKKSIVTTPTAPAMEEAPK